MKFTFCHLSVEKRKKNDTANNSEKIFIKSLSGFLLLEALAALTITAILLPIFLNILNQELKNHEKFIKKQDVRTQILFVQNTLQKIFNNAEYISSNGSKIFITTSKNITEVGYRKKAVYIKKKVYRYLTTEPFNIDNFNINKITSSCYQVSIYNGSTTTDIVLRK